MYSIGPECTHTLVLSFMLAYLYLYGSSFPSPPPPPPKVKVKHEPARILVHSLTNSLIETELGNVRLRRGYRGKQKKKAHTLARLCPVIIVPLLLALLLHNPSIHPSCLSALFLFAFSSPHFFPSHVFPVLLITDCQLAMAAAAKFNEFSGSEVCSLFCLFANWFGSGYVPAAATTLNGRFWISGVISSPFLCVLVFFLVLVPLLVHHPVITADGHHHHHHHHLIISQSWPPYYQRGQCY